MFLLAHHWTCWWKRGGWNWQYHCRSALKGGDGPLHYTVAGMSTVEEEEGGGHYFVTGWVCRLTFQLVVIRSSARASSRDHQIAARTTSLHIWPFSTWKRRGVSEGRKGEKLGLPANIYGSSYFLHLPPSLYFFPSSLLRFMFIFALNLPLISCIPPPLVRRWKPAKKKNVFLRYNWGNGSSEN